MSPRQKACTLANHNDKSGIIPELGGNAAEWAIDSRRVGELGPGNTKFSLWLLICKFFHS